MYVCTLLIYLLYFANIAIAQLHILCIYIHFIAFWRSNNSFNHRFFIKMEYLDLNCRHCRVSRYYERRVSGYVCSICKLELSDEAVIHYEDERMAELDQLDHSTPEDAINRGVSIFFLVEFTNKHKCWDKTTRFVQQNFILPATYASRCRYVELEETRNRLGSVGRALTFVSHSWDGFWGTLVAALMDGFADLSHFVWIDIFAIRQW